MHGTIQTRNTGDLGLDSGDSQVLPQGQDLGCRVRDVQKDWEKN